jgi:hypothetical protein
MSTMVGEYSIEHLLKTAKASVEKKTANSIVLDKEAEDRIPRFDEKGTSVHGEITIPS